MKTSRLKDTLCALAKRSLCASFALFVAAALSACAVGARATGAPKVPSATAYTVRVEIGEVENRIVEGKVRGHTLRADQPKAFGADDTAPTPPETLAFALGSCVVSTGRLIALQRKLPIRKISAVVEGELDFAKAMGANAEQRAGFFGLKIAVDIDGDLEPQSERELLREIGARCPMCDNLANETPLSLELAPEAR